MRLLSEEYVKAFVVKTRMKDLSLDDKRKRYFYLLNSSGLYHDLKEKLKVSADTPLRKSTANHIHHINIMLMLSRGRAGMLSLHSCLMIVCLCGFCWIVWQPRIQRLVRKRFGQAPQNERQKDELVSTLYSSLMEQAGNTQHLK